MARKSAESSTRQTRTTVTSRRPRASKKAAATEAPTQEQITARAYEIYCERMRTGQPGSQDSDWSAAEAELNGVAGR